MSKRRVVVTGLGAVTPVGLSVVESWENILAGKSGVAPITSFDVTDFPVRFGASVKGFDVETVISRKDAKKWIPLFTMALLQQSKQLKMLVWK